MSFGCHTSRPWCDSQDLRCQSETLSNRKKRQSKGFNHAAWSYNHLDCIHIDTNYTHAHWTAASKGVTVTAMQSQAVNEQYCDLLKSAGFNGEVTATLLLNLDLVNLFACVLMSPSHPVIAILTCCANQGLVGSPGKALDEWQWAIPCTYPTSGMSSPTSKSSCWITEEQQLMGFDSMSDSLPVGTLTVLTFTY